MYPLPPEWKSWIQVKVTFCFWPMYPPRSKKVGHRSKWHFASGWCTPPKIEIGLNMNAIGKISFQERSSSTFYQSTPPPTFHYHYLILCLNRKLSISISNGYLDLNPIHQPSPAKKIKCSFLDYVQLLVIGWAGRWTQTPSTTPSSQKNKMLIFGLCSTSDDQPGWSMDSNPIHHPSPAKNIKCSY